MKLLIVDKKIEKINILNKSLKLDDKTVPLHLFDVMILGYGICLEAKLLHTLTQENRYLILLNRKNDAVLIHSFGSHNAELKLRQYHAAITPLHIAKEILKHKISNHISTMQQNSPTDDVEMVFDKIEQATQLQTLLGIEGSFSRSYFTHYFSRFPKLLHKSKRSKQPPKDPVNAMLSYYYTLFYRLIAIRLHAYGFEPSIGFLHRPFRSHFALSSDILELSRAQINEEVARLFLSKTLTAEDFTKRGDGVYLRFESRRNLWSEFQLFYTDAQKQIEQSINLLRSMI